MAVASTTACRPAASGSRCARWRWRSDVAAECTRVLSGYGHRAMHHAMRLACVYLCTRPSCVTRQRHTRRQDSGVGPSPSQGGAALVVAIMNGRSFRPGKQCTRAIGAEHATVLLPPCHEPDTVEPSGRSRTRGAWQPSARLRCCSTTCSTSTPRAAPRCVQPARPRHRTPAADMSIAHPKANLASVTVKESLPFRRTALAAAFVVMHALTISYAISTAGVPYAAALAEQAKLDANKTNATLNGTLSDILNSTDADAAAEVAQPEEPPASCLSAVRVPNSDPSRVTTFGTREWHRRGSS
mmetsp:Transcript_3474/g.10969  ORF Transcript_3474/g.10969 Transcript_3474/m.10969 type:complete len:299 (-) Transcript_3474:65-961(-)